jgi:hypothetical protein
MKRLLLEVTEELLKVLDAGKADDESRNAFIERCLWSSPAIKRTAAELGIAKPVRRKRGKPSRSEGEK